MMNVSKTADGTPHNDPPSATETVAKLRLALRSFSLAELEEQDIVTWDKRNHVVREGPEFEGKAIEILDNG